MISEERLISAIFLQTLKDWKRSEYRSDVGAFLGSEWFGTLADGIGLDPDEMRRKLETGKIQARDIRAVYR
jgi:hypothetical protein